MASARAETGQRIMARRIDLTTPLGRELAAAAERAAALQVALEDILSAVWHEERAWTRNVQLEGARIGAGRLELS